MLIVVARFKIIKLILFIFFVFLFFGFQIAFPYIAYGGIAEFMERNRVSGAWPLSVFFCFIIIIFSLLLAFSAIIHRGVAIYIYKNELISNVPFNKRIKMNDIAEVYAPYEAIYSRILVIMTNGKTRYISTRLFDRRSADVMKIIREEKGLR
jgi:hypothetical protein